MGTFKNLTQRTQTVHGSLCMVMYILRSSIQLSQCNHRKREGWKEQKIDYTDGFYTQKQEQSCICAVESDPRKVFYSPTLCLTYIQYLQLLCLIYFYRRYPSDKVIWLSLMPKLFQRLNFPTSPWYFSIRRPFFNEGNRQQEFKKGLQNT